MDIFIQQCQEIIGTEYVYIGEVDKAPYLTDWGKRFTGQSKAVLKPKNVHEVASLVKLCQFHKIAIVPQGGNTGLCGGATPDKTGNSVVISTARLNAVRNLDLENAAITLEAGVILSHAQETALGAGKLFPLSLAAEGSCTIGGNLATNAGGVQVLHYGNMRDLTLGLEVVTPNGDIFNGLRGLRKDNTGYSLKDLYIGSEGTLGIITAATLKLYPLPCSKATAMVGLTSVKSAIDLIELSRMKSNANLTAFELISTRALNLVTKTTKNFDSLLNTTSGWVVLLEFSSMEDGTNSQARIETLLSEAFTSGLITDAMIANSIQQSKELWSIRETIPEAQLKLGTIIKHDISLPISALPDFILSAQVKLNDLYPNASTIIFGHLGDGNLHYNLAPNSPELSEWIEENRSSINQLIHNEVYKFSGSFSAEHGIGQSKRDELPQRKSAVEIELMRTIKKALDPQNIMNPGKIL
ncbi:FAD-binding oxidoreductase [Polynucleobacter sp. AP-Jannik-300A-C4]|uniref:FAD-binding oxidoreductase n=1 Tax=Polynucleobacter sp. AP-Jannik-300A-C4 TaxID=2576928 RepID=UPI001BFD4EB0|nr:FAD-binding oxidoreductase [Polynucleobacter sp. AP-Jannik-300A-C4]QWE22018.1 FAD-binding oxidoreductase [Polynucleobacter sp. AP-Jannik-300A-C4]